MNFHVNFCEYNRSNAPKDRIYRPHGSGDYLFLLLKTPMRMRLGEVIQVSRENACILYTPDMLQDYQAVDKFRNSYIHFSCSQNPADHFHLPSNTLFYPSTYTQVDAFLRRLQEVYMTDALYATEEAYHLFCELLICAARGLTEAGHPPVEQQALFQQFCALRFEMLRNYEKDWGTERLCHAVNLEKSQFFSYYHRFFHSTPHADLLQVRMEKAKSLLTNEALPITQIAAQCGFTDLSHFSRCFKKEYGCAPSHYIHRD